MSLVTSSCAGGRQGTGSSTTSTTSLVGSATARATVSPDQGVAGTTLTFSVQIRGPGTLGSEAVLFGDGATSGVKAADVACGVTARADHVSTYVHAYARPGTYQFADEVTIQAPPPSCRLVRTTARLTLVVAAPLTSATLNGAFVSPTMNLACNIDVTATNSVRCVSLFPPRLVTMDASGSYRTCSGDTCNLGNPAMETPVLPYGWATGAGPFQCLSTEVGITCTVVGHKGFTISRAGIERVS